MIHVPGEAEFKGRGVSYCATCDGDFFTGKDIVVVGGGNSALEEAVSLTKYARNVAVVHQFDQFQAFPYAVEEAKANPKIKFYMESQVRNIIGEDSVKQVEIEHLPTSDVAGVDALEDAGESPEAEGRVVRRPGDVEARGCGVGGGHLISSGKPLGERGGVHEGNGTISGFCPVAEQGS